MNEIILRIITSIFSGLIFFGTYFFLTKYFLWLLVLILFFILFFEWPKIFSYKSWKFWLIMPLYPIFPMLCLMYLFINYVDINILIPIYPFIVAWTFDSCSYIAGKIFGKHKIIPSVSPKKTWEGLGGGFVGTLLLNYVIFLNGSSIIFTLIVTIIFSALAFLGDIFESLLKRKAHIKDSGNILPGHGGLLDRFDSVFFIAIIITFFILLLEYQTKILMEQLYIQAV